MRKRVFCLCFISFLLFACAKAQENTPADEPPEVLPSEGEGDNTKTHNILADNDFSQGFKLLEPRNDGKRVFCPNINYGGEADGQPVWEMSQWASPYNFKNATYTKQENGSFCSLRSSSNFALIFCVSLCVSLNAK